MKMKTPKESKISVIIPCYNQGKYIDEAVDSVLNQTYQNFEIIIVDDGSTDNYTRGLLENFKKPKTKVYRTENKGASSARNYGFRKANGEYIQFLDADDFLDSKKFEKQIEVFQNDKALDIVYSNYKYYLDKEKIFFEHKKYNPGMDVKITKDTYEDFLFGWQRTLSIPIHSPLFRKNLWDKGLPFVEGFGVGEDWIMWINLAKNGAQMFFLDEELAFYRLHQKSMTHNKSYLIYWVSRSISYIADNLVKEEYKERFDKESEQYLNKLINNLFVSESTKELDLYKKKVKQYEESFSWRITKPLRILEAILRKFLQFLKNKSKFKFNKEKKTWLTISTPKSQ